MTGRKSTSLQKLRDTEIYRLDSHTSYRHRVDDAWSRRLSNVIRVGGKMVLHLVTSTMIDMSVEPSITYRDLLLGPQHKACHLQHED